MNKKDNKVINEILKIIQKDITNKGYCIFNLKTFNRKFNDIYDFNSFNITCWDILENTSNWQEYKKISSKVYNELENKLKSLGFKIYSCLDDYYIDTPDGLINLTLDTIGIK